MWESKIKTWMERYEEASSNQYSEDVQVLLRVKEQGDGKNLAYNTHPASFKPPVEVVCSLFCLFWVTVRLSSFADVRLCMLLRVRFRRTRRSSKQCGTCFQTPSSSSTGGSSCFGSSLRPTVTSSRGRGILIAFS